MNTKGRDALRAAVPKLGQIQAAVVSVHSRDIELDAIDVVPGLNARGYATGDAAFSGPAFEELKSSISRFGVLQPVLLRPFPGREGQYQLVAGERRLRAAQELGLSRIPAEVRQMTDEEMEQASREENRVREGVRELDFKLKVLEAMARYGGVNPRELRTVLLRIRNNPAEEWAEDTVRGRVLMAMRELVPDATVSTLVRSWTRYLEFTEDERLALRDGVGESVLLPLLDLEEGEQRENLLRQAVHENWTAVQMQAAIRTLLKRPVAAEGLVKASKAFKSVLSPVKLAGLTEKQQDELQQELAALKAKYFG